MNARPAPNLPPRTAPNRRAGWVAAGAIVLLTVLAYHGTFAVPFVFDDIPSIEENLSIRHFATAWWAPIGGTTTGRPVVNLTLALNYALSGLNVRSYHVVNLAIHVGAVLALFGVVRRTLHSRLLPAWLAADATGIAGGVAGLWALHPLQTEAVTYVVQRAESLMALFYLLTLYAFARGSLGPPLDGKPVEGGGRRWLFIAFFTSLLGMASKEVMASAPVIVLLYDRTFVAGTFRAAWQQRRGFYLALASTWLVLGGLVLASQGRGHTAGFGTTVSVWDYALTQCHAIAHYLRLVVWPAPLVFDYGTITVTQFAAIVGPAGFLVALIAATVFALRAQPAWGFLGVCFFAILAPTSSFVPIATQTMAEHRMYLPLAVVLLLGVIALYRWLGRFAVIVTGVAALGLGWLTLQRNETYRDDYTLWNDTATKVPTNARAHNNLGLAQARAGQPGAAMASFQTALRLNPDYLDALNNLGVALTKADRTAEALPFFAHALSVDPASSETHSNFGSALTGAGQVAEGLAHFERALQLKSGSAKVHSNFALALVEAGQIDRALAEFATAQHLDAVPATTLDRFGFALFKARRLPDAITQFEAALLRDPALASAHNHLGLALAQSDRGAEGLSHLTEAVRLAPADAEMKNDLGVALAMAGRMEEAAGQFEQAVRLKPDFAEAERNRSRARAQLSGR